MKSWLPEDACADAVEWVGKMTPAKAWAKCNRADWMLWLVGRECGRCVMVLCACDCARTVLRHVPKGETCTLAAIEAAEKWARNPTEENREAAWATSSAAARVARAAGASAASAEAEVARASAWVGAWVSAAAARVAAWGEAFAEAEEEVVRASADASAWAAQAEALQAAGAAEVWAGAAEARAGAHKEMCGLICKRIAMRRGKLVALRGEAK